MTIHPMFAIDEKARIFRVCVWFSPPHPPTIIDMSPVARSIVENTTFTMEMIRIIGAIFCQVAIISPCRNGSPCKTSGNQK